MTDPYSAYSVLTSKMVLRNGFKCRFKLSILYLIFLDRHFSKFRTRNAIKSHDEFTSCMKVKVVLFDLGDTLVKTKKGIYLELLKSLHESLISNSVNLPFEELKKAYFEVREKEHEIIRQTLKEIDFSKRISETLSNFGYVFKQNDKIITDACEAFFKPFIDTTTIVKSALKVLSALKKKYRLGVVSDFLYPPAFRKMLQKFKLMKYFDIVVISSEVGWRKPHPAIFQAALKSLEVSPYETVFVGDSIKRDIIPAKKLGMRTILIDLCGKTSLDKLSEEEKPDYLLFKLEDVLNVL